MFSAQYFIDKLSAIPDAQWCTGKFDNGRGQKCALGHTGWKVSMSMADYNFPEANCLIDLFEKVGAHVSNVNDGLKICTKNSHIRQIISENKKPKDRIVKTLQYIKERQRL